MATIEEQLWSAVLGNNVAEVDRLLRQPVNVNWNNNSFHGFTCLHTACWKGHLPVLRLLLKHKDIDTNRSKTDGWPPFSLACRDGQTEAVKEMLKDPRVDLNKADDSGVTAVWLAALNGRIDVVKWIIASGRQVNWEARTTLRHVQPNSSPLDAAKNREPLEEWDGEEKRRNMRGRREIIPLVEKLLQDPIKVRQEIREEIGVRGINLIQEHLGISFGAFEPDNPPLKHPSEVRRLNLAWIGLEILPDTICQFSHLLDLDASHNILKDLPPNFSQLTSLRKLNIGSNQFSSNNYINLLEKSESLFEIKSEGNPSLLPETLSKRMEKNKLAYEKNLETIARYFHIQIPPNRDLHFLPVNFNGIFDIASLDISGCPTSNFTAFQEAVVKFIELGGALKFLNLHSAKIDPDTALRIIRTMIQNFTKGNLILQRLEMDDMDIPVAQDLPLVPVELQRQGLQKVIQFLLDFYHSPMGEPLYRTKLMVVGFESVGKTTILDCLFPIANVGRSQGQVIKKTYTFHLQGSKFYKTKDGETKPHKDRVYILRNREWRVEVLDNNGISLKRSNEAGIPAKDVAITKEAVKDTEFYLENPRVRDAWYTRLRRVVMNEATHGIEISTQVLETASTKARVKGNSKLELSIWDFAGQHDYYNNHHYFLSSRTVFLLLYKMSDENGISGLKFWFKSLAAHLPRSQKNREGQGAEPAYYSLIVIGTFLDKVPKEEYDREKRKQEVLKVAAEVGFSPDDIKYQEVSCYDLTNIEEARDLIAQAALSHAYMGEMIPKSYMVIREFAQQLQHEYQPVPIVNIDKFYGRFPDKELVKRTLLLLTLWGEVIYFDTPQELSTTVILDPKFLAKDVLGQIFNPAKVNLHNNGIVNHANLTNIWGSFKARADFNDLAAKLIGLMEKFEVCFRFSEGQNRPWLEQKSIIPALLPEEQPAEVADFFPKETPYGSIHIERWVIFNIVPKEMVGRLLVRLHNTMEESRRWRHGMYFDFKNCKALITVDLEKNSLLVAIRDKSRQEAVKTMEHIVSHVNTISLVYPGISYQQCYPSPYDSNSFLVLEDCFEDYNKDPQERNLKCKSTRQLVDSEKILIDAGMLDGVVAQTEKYVWDLQTVPLAWHRIEVANPFQVLDFRPWDLQNQAAFDPELYGKLVSILKDVDLTSVEYIRAVSNSLLTNGFQYFLSTLKGKVKAKEKLFKKDDYKLLKDAYQREQYLLRFKDITRKAEVFEKSNIGTNVIPLFYATTEEHINNICQNGFVGVTDENGYYGKGIYFTSDLNYAKTYGPISPTRKKYIVVSVVALGNPFPLTEHPFQDDNGETFKTVKNGVEVEIHNPNGYVSKAGRTGYQSHFVLVNKDEPKRAFPIRGEFTAEFHTDVIVVFQESQALPVLILVFDAAAIENEAAHRNSMLMTMTQMGSLQLNN